VNDSTHLGYDCVHSHVGYLEWGIGTEQVRSEEVGKDVWGRPAALRVEES
jgi:hypothetical protein